MCRYNVHNFILLWVSILPVQFRFFPTKRNKANKKNWKSSWVHYMYTYDASIFFTRSSLMTNLLKASDVILLLTNYFFLPKMDQQIYWWSVMRFKYIYFTPKKCVLFLTRDTLTNLLMTSALCSAVVLLSTIHCTHWESPLNSEIERSSFGLSLREASIA